MVPCGYSDRLFELLENEVTGKDMQTHLKQCAECRAEQKRYNLLISSLIHQKVDAYMEEAEKNGSLPNSKLPHPVLELVNQRKKQWEKSQLKKVLGSQGYTTKEEQQKRLKELLKEPPSDLPLAAYPDDLNDDES